MKLNHGELWWWKVSPFFGYLIHCKLLQLKNKLQGKTVTHSTIKVLHHSTSQNCVTAFIYVGLEKPCGVGWAELPVISKSFGNDFFFLNKGSSSNSLWPYFVLKPKYFRLTIFSDLIGLNQIFLLTQVHSNRKLWPNLTFFILMIGLALKYFQN